MTDFLKPKQASAFLMERGIRLAAATLNSWRCTNPGRLPFVRIGDGCLVGAGSVVTHDLPHGMVAFGNPARVRGRVADLLDIGERVVPDPSSAARYGARERQVAQA